MIVFDLQCDDGCDAFEAWFRSSADYDEQRDSGLVQCPFCQSASVSKAPMAPRVPKKGSDGLLTRLAAMQAEMLKQSRWVGDEFTDTARACTAAKSSRRSCTAVQVSSRRSRSSTMAFPSRRFRFRSRRRTR